MTGRVPAVIGACSAALVFAIGMPRDAGASPADVVALPKELGGYSYFTGSVSSRPPGAAIALYQHGYGVEFLDYPQAVVLGAGGDTYRRLDVAEDRAGRETQGDPAPMLLSPDGTKVAVGDHDSDDHDVVIVDLVTGDTTSHRLPSGRSVVPIAWSRDGQQLAQLLTPEPTNPHLGVPIGGSVGVLDLATGETTVLPDSELVRSAAFSPDGSELALQRGGLTVVDLATGSERSVDETGVLAGPASWSPDGRLIATKAPSGFSFADATGRGVDVPEPVELALNPQGQVLGWSGPDEVLTLLDGPGADRMEGPDAYILAAASLDGAQPKTLMIIEGLQNYGVNRFQLASATVDGLAVVTHADIDRGPWPLPLRAGQALLLGLVAWVVTWTVIRRKRAG